MSRAQPPRAKPHLVAGIVLVLAVIGVPVFLLTVAGTGLPPAVRSLVSLLVLPGGGAGQLVALEGRGTG